MACLGIAVTATAQEAAFPAHFAYQSITGYSSAHQDAESVLANPATSVNLRQLSAALFAKRQFLSDGDQLMSLSAAIPLKHAAAGFSADLNAFALFKEQHFAGFYARALSERSAVALRIHQFSYSIPGYEGYSAIYGEAAACFSITSKLVAGITAVNPAGKSFGGKKGAEPLGSLYTAGLGYDVSEAFHLHFSAWKQGNTALQIRSGFQYQFNKKFFARGGFRSDNNSGFGGIGFAYKKFRIDLFSDFHPQLGFSPSIMFIYFKAKTSEL